MAQRLPAQLVSVLHAPRNMPLDVFPTEPTASVELSSFDHLHRELAQLNRARLVPCQDTFEWGRLLDASHWEAALASEVRLRRREHDFVEAERREVQDAAVQVPRDASGFVTWFEALRESGPGQGHRLFPWLAHEAPMGAMRWFLEQELAGEAGFEDLLALTQLRLPKMAKLELARNYWDEMGQGKTPGMHGPLLDQLGQALSLSPRIETTVWESLALANMMVALAANRPYAYQSIGALGVIELTAPGRSVQVNAGLKRLGVSGEARRYYALHATLDVKHSAAWNREVLHSLVERDARVAPLIAEGALLRLRAGERCFERYGREFGLGSA